MNVLKHGKTYHEIICLSCEAAFGFLDSEIKDIFDDKNFHNSSYTRVIKCPECKKNTILYQFVNGEEICDMLK